MKRIRHNEETIILVLSETRAGGMVAELCRRCGISEARRLKLLEEENRKLKKLVADQARYMMVLKDLLSKNAMKKVISSFGLSLRRVCRITG